MPYVKHKPIEKFKKNIGHTQIGESYNIWHAIDINCSPTASTTAQRTQCSLAKEGKKYLYTEGEWNEN